MEAWKRCQILDIPVVWVFKILWPEPLIPNGVRKPSSGHDRKCLLGETSTQKAFVQKCQTQKVSL